jgi:hypothetical protein
MPLAKNLAENDSADQDDHNGDDDYHPYGTGRRAVSRSRGVDKRKVPDRVRQHVELKLCARHPAHGGIRSARKPGLL